MSLDVDAVAPPGTAGLLLTGPTGTSADLAWILAAVAALGGAGTILLGPGTWDLGSGATGLDMDGKVAFKGSGIDDTILRYRGAGAGVRFNSGAGITTANWRLSDMTIDGDGDGAYGLRLGQGAASPKGATGAVERIRSTGCGLAGVHLVSAQIVNWLSVLVQDNLGDGVVIDGSGGGANTENLFLGLRCEGNDGVGVKIIGSSNSTTKFVKGVFENNGLEGVLIVKANANASDFRGIVFEDCRWENNLADVVGTGRATDARTLGAFVNGMDVALIRPEFSGTAAADFECRIGGGEFVIDHPRLSSVLHGQIGLSAGNTCTTNVALVLKEAPTVDWNLVAGGGATRGSALVTDFSASLAGNPEISTWIASSGAWVKSLEVGPGRVAAANSQADATLKTGRYSVPHYTNAEEPFDLLIGSANAAANTLNIGGGSSAANAATIIAFWAAATSTTTTGTKVLELQNAKIGEFGAAPVAKSAAIPDPAGGAIIDAECRAALAALLAYFRLRGTVTP